MTPVWSIFAAGAFLALWVWAAVVYRRLRAATGLRCFAFFQAFYATGAVLWVLAIVGTRLMSSVVHDSPSVGLAVAVAKLHIVTMALGLLAASTFWTAGSCYRWFREYDDWRAVLQAGAATSGSRAAGIARVAFLGRVPLGLELSHSPSGVRKWEGVLMGVTYLVALAYVAYGSRELPRVLWGHLPGFARLLYALGWLLLLWFAGCAVAVIACGLVYGRPGWRWSR